MKSVGCCTQGKVVVNYLKTTYHTESNNFHEKKKKKEISAFHKANKGQVLFY